MTTGTRVILTGDVDRYPHFIAPKGATGTVTHCDEYAICVRLDEHLSGAEEWDNEVHWYPENGDEITRDIEVCAEQTEATMTTIACEIGKHKICDGTGTHEDTGETVACGCHCHAQAAMQFEPYEQTNPKAHARGPYALRYAGGRPEGSFPTITEAVAAARPGASVVTADGWWIVGRCAEQTEAT